MELIKGDVVLCKFYFSDFQQFKNRPVLIIRSEIPFEDVIGIPISSKVAYVREDELLLNGDNFSYGGVPVVSKLMIRKTFLVSKELVLKKYGTLKPETLASIDRKICEFWNCG